MAPRWHDDPSDDFDDTDLDGADEDWADLVHDPETAFVPCPLCGADVHEEALRCAVCGRAMPQTQSVFAGRPWWWIVLGAVGVAATMFALALAHGAPDADAPRDGASKPGGGMVRHFVERHQIN